MQIINKFEQQVARIKHAPSRVIFLLAFFIGAFLTSFLFIGNGVVSGIIEVLNLNFGGGLIKVYFPLAILSLLVALLVILLLSIFPIMKGRRWFLASIFIMAFIFIFGFFGTHEAVGNRALPQLYLFDEQGTKQGLVSCTSYSKALLGGEELNCKFELDPLLLNITKQVSLTHKNSETSELIINDGKFIPSSNVTYIYFVVRGADERGFERRLHVGYPYNPLDYKDFKEHQSKFLTLILGLFVVVFVTVPIALKNLRDLYKN